MKFRRIQAVLMLCLFTSEASAACSIEKIALSLGDRVAFEGDSLTYGFDGTSTGTRIPINGSEFRRNINSFPEKLQEKLRNSIHVVNRGFPGDQTDDGLERWAYEKSVSLTFLMYGTNDAMNYGGNARGALTTERYRSSLESLIRRRSIWGAVVILTPPPVRNTGDDAVIENYRTTAKVLAKRYNLKVLDTAEIIKDVAIKWTDDVHLSAESNEKLAEALAQAICVDGI